MKKIFTKLMLLAVAAAAFVSCENNIDESTPIVELTQTVTLSAEKPVGVRTELIEGVPYWSKGDAIGVYTKQEKDASSYEFKNNSNEASLTTSFTGQTAVANTLYVYYPYTANGVAEKGAKIDIPANQEPTATSFDGKADIMLAKPVTLDAEGKQLNNLEFARLGAIVKIVLKDNTSSLAGQHISSLTMTAANNLTGRVYVDVVNQELGELYYGGSKSVNATYSEATQYEVNGTNATYVIVYPQTLAAGSTLSFEASTEGYAISKSIELGQDIVLESGKVTTLNVSLKAENLVKEETGLALPFEDDFARIAIDASEGAISSLGDNYSSIEKIYKSKVTAGAVKFGTSSAAGHITTVPLNLSQPFTVIVAALGYKDTETVMKVTVGEVSQTINLTTSEAYYGVEFEAATKKSAVTIETAQDGKRFYLTDLQVVAGHDVVLPTLPPVLTVSKSEISVSHEAATETFTYSVANPVEGVNVAISDNADWITTSVNGNTVTVTVVENTVEEAREGAITVTYGDLTKTVTVKQSAKPAEGGSEVTVTTVGFESSEGFTASTTYNNTSIKYFGKTGKQWGTVCGTATTSDAISGSQSMQMRVYKTTGPVSPYVFMNYQEASVSKISFKAKGSVTTNTLTLSYKTTGDWVTVKTYTLKTSSQEFTHEFDTALENVSFKFTFVYPSNYTDKSKITIDDVTFTSGGNGGSTPEPEQPGGGTTAEVFTLLGTDFGYQNGYTSVEASITSKTDGSVWKAWGWMKSSATAAAIQFGAKSKNYILTPACSNDINTIELTCSGSYTVALWDASTDKVITGMYAKPTTTDTSGNGSVKFTLPAGYKQVKIISTRTANGSSITGSNAATYITKIVVTSK